MSRECGGLSHALLKEAFLPIFIFICSFWVVHSLLHPIMFGHDEAVYATKARSIADGGPAETFAVYRPLGMAVLGSFIYQLIGRTEDSFRLFGVFFGAFSILWTYLLFRSTTSRIAATVTAVSVLYSKLFLQTSPTFLNDIASSGLLLCTIWAIWICFVSRGRSGWIYLAAPSAALAFYLRYGVSSTLCLIILVSVCLFLFYRSNRLGFRYRHVICTAVIGLVLLVPHILHSVTVFGDPLGILKLAGRAAGRHFLGEGLLAYLRWIPRHLAGCFAGMLILLGILATLYFTGRWMFRKRIDQNQLALLWLGLIGVFNILLTGLLVHAEPRYVFLSLVLLAGVGVAVLTLLIGARMSRRGQLASYGLLSALLLYTGHTNYSEAKRRFARLAEHPVNTHILDVAERIKADMKIAEAKDCVVYTAASRPQLSWYTNCKTMRPTTPTPAKAFLLQQPDSTPVYSLVYSAINKDQFHEQAMTSTGFAYDLLYANACDSDKLGDARLYRIRFPSP